eukprot:CAMPEP_0178707166 /NCGR_PEP_ID=MMETSP0699-20121125/15848_1 /TAXON_ID=265572 /ORGANISM="Extubocellulus spinifer, Strain CCMP396" /LENGTH=163 /DNA_ID=CAMNT_0020355121 /DNA_START=808 /DNA_END=1299 /DNA_ORIENTATION=+
MSTTTSNTIVFNRKAIASVSALKRKERSPPTSNSTYTEKDVTLQDFAATAVASGVEPFVDSSPSSPEKKSVFGKEFFEFQHDEDSSDNSREGGDQDATCTGTDAKDNQDVQKQEGGAQVPIHNGEYQGIVQTNPSRQDSAPLDDLDSLIFIFAGLGMDWVVYE